MNFEDIYMMYYRDVYLFVFALSKNPDLAEEITQETFFKALRKHRQFKGNCSVKSWLCQIAKNLYISHTRKKDYCYTPVPDDLPSPGNVEKQVEQKQASLSIYKILHHLGEPYKEVFTLRVLGDLSFREIAEIFNHNENWARVTYHRAKHKIQNLIKQKEDFS